MFWRKQSETQKNWNEFFDNPKPGTFYINPIIIIIVIICLGSAILYFSKNQTPEEIPLSNTVDNNIHVQSNKNGITMVESINTIEKIMSDKIIDSTEEELKEYISTIEKIDLSIEYMTFKQKMIEKINYYIEYIKTNNIEYLKKYDSINFIDEITAAFDSAGVEYEVLENEKIKYWYKK